MLSAAAIVLWIDRGRFSHAEERSNDGYFDKKGMIMMGLNERSLKYLVFPLPLGSGYYRTFKKKIGGPFAVAVRRNFFPY